MSSPPRRIIFMGTADLSAISLEKLARDPRFQIVAVITQPDKPRGRELKLQATPVKVLADRLNLPVLQPLRARDPQFLETVRELRPELIIVVAYGQILPQALLDLPTHGCLNVHTSILPKYRGAAPIQWAIANGETVTGVTIMKMDAGLDTGPMLATRTTPITADDNAAILHDRLAQLGAELLLETIPGYLSGECQPRPQPLENHSYAAKIKKEDGRILWQLPARQIWHRFRAFTPWPGSYTYLPGTDVVEPALLAGTVAAPALPDHKRVLLKLWQLELAEGEGLPGEILVADKHGITVACGEAAVRLLELQREGGKRLAAAAFLAGHPLRLHQRFP